MLRRPPSPPLFPYTTLFRSVAFSLAGVTTDGASHATRVRDGLAFGAALVVGAAIAAALSRIPPPQPVAADRKSTRLNSSHVSISYAVFCLKKKTYKQTPHPL